MTYVETYCVAVGFGAGAGDSRGRGNTLFLRIREKQVYILDDAALDESLTRLDEEFQKEPAHVVVNLEEVQYLPEEYFHRLNEFRQTVEASGHHLAIVNGNSSMRALMQKDAPDLVGSLADNEKKAAALVTTRD